MCALTTEKSHGASSHSWIPDAAFIRQSANDKGGSTQHFSVETAASGDSVVYDVGAGTGSVSIEAACMQTVGLYMPSNRRKSCGTDPGKQQKVRGIQSAGHSRKAPDAFVDLETPTHAFLGEPWKHAEIIGWLRNEIRRSGL